MLTFQPIPAELSDKGFIALATYRAKVPGGWIVIILQSGFSVGANPFFVPDPKHEWDGSSLPTDGNR
jgi:hypothetical protein